MFPRADGRAKPAPDDSAATRHWIMANDSGARLEDNAHALLL
jgi:hypothetical protein